MSKSGESVLENVRRYRAIASLHRQTAAFRPVQRASLLAQAEEWEERAMTELEAYFKGSESRVRERPPQIRQRDMLDIPAYVYPPNWETRAAA
jgi:hypothetical protein